MFKGACACTCIHTYYIASVCCNVFSGHFNCFVFSKSHCREQPCAPTSACRLHHIMFQSWTDHTSECGTWPSVGSQPVLTLFCDVHGLARSPKDAVGHSPIVQYPDPRIQCPVSLWQIPRQDIPGQTAHHFQIAVQRDTAQCKLSTPPQHQVTLITKTLLPSWYRGSETLTCGDPHNFPGMLKIPFASPVKRVWCPFLKMDAPSQGPGFRSVPETWVAWQESWMVCAVGHYREQDESGTRGFLPLGLLPGQTRGRRDLEDPCDQSSSENTWYHNKDVWKLWLWARAQPTGNLRMQSYFRSQGMNEWMNWQLNAAG